MSRRGENIRKRKDGRWEGRYSVFKPQAGKKVVHSVYAKTYSEVKEKLSAAKMSAKSQEKISDAEVSFRMAAKEWLTAVESSKKHATYIKYRSIYEKHIQEKLDGYNNAAVWKGQAIWRNTAGHTRTEILMKTLQNIAKVET